MPPTIYFIGTSWTEAGAPPEVAKLIAEKGYVVYNAPRHLPGAHVWEGPFRHGILYAAVDPRDVDTVNFIYGGSVTQLDGWPCELITKAEVHRRVRAHIEEVIAEYGDGLSAQEIEDLRTDPSHFDHYREQLDFPAVTPP